MIFSLAEASNQNRSNFITASLMEVISEAHVFAEKSGLGTGMLESLVELNWGGILYGTSSRITSGAYIPPEGTVIPLSKHHLQIFPY